MRTLVWLFLVLVCSGCIAAPPLGAPRSVLPQSSPTPEDDGTLFARSGQNRDAPSVFGPPHIVTPIPDFSSYRDDVDVRELAQDVAAYWDVPLRYEGVVWTVVPEGDLVFVQVKVPFGQGSADWQAIVVMFPSYRVPIDTTVIREGVTVVVWGRPRTMLRFTDDAGNEVEQPLLLGDRIAVAQR
ncbi:MAG: hypothetical protein RMH81_00355 [Thermomicrobium sp.]|nr:hypothetical protein [Thermomicrobium sp.]